MKLKNSLRGASLLALSMFAVTLSTSFPMWPRGQVANSRSHSNPHDLAAQVTAFGNYSKDFREMEKPLRGEELEVLEFLDGVATAAEDRMFAANAMLRMYDGISCKPDRASAKRILKEQLEYHSWQMDNEATRTTGGLAFAKVPAVAKMGIRMNDDLRAAKNQLDAISASLD